MKTKADIIEARIRKAFNKGCVKYSLLEDGDRILIALSGGKDSLELVRLLSQRARIFKPSIKVEAAHIIMDNIPYETDRTYIQHFCESLGVRLHILHSSFNESTDPNKTKCFLCSWNRRKTLFEFACANGFNKIALGHHNDDILTTFLMNITFEGSTQTMLPKLQMKHYDLQIIRPLCLVPEADIKEIAAELGFTKQKALCPYETTSQRATMTDMLHRLESINPEARYSLWNAMGL
ncbi:MAG: tRNA 2-thiocytidine biosynthesis protein TtcA [Bacteroidaceae bacterium]|jgi:tRNA(Ile)-lysidine synthase TilS/MesJ|nr:tRNA 2-thiocytidine biosynthesis protein TtcA [Bacteroidaceae bacterium]